MSRTIKYEEMAIHNDFIFGKLLNNPDKQPVIWNPNSKQCNNPHIIITGESGTGKSLLLKKLIEYVGKNHHVIIIDFHGDLKIDGIKENLIEIRGRNSEWGLNPFYMEQDERNGGPKRGAEIIVSMIKKSYVPNLGAKQKQVFERLVYDTYVYVGITDEDVESWNKKLPTVRTMEELYKKILRKINAKNGVEFDTHFNKVYELQEKYEKAKLYEDIDDKEKLLKKIEKEFTDIRTKLDRFQRWVEGDVLLDDEFKIDNSNGIDYSYYLDPSIKKILENIGVYVNALASSSIFTSKQLPITNGVNRIDISGIVSQGTPSEALFFSDILIQRVFRASMMKGDYRNRKSFKLNGKKVDTFIFLDESKLVLPTGKEKENPYNIFNRIVTESRKFALGIIIASQRLTHYTDEILSNTYTKISFKTSSKEMKNTAKALDVDEASLKKTSRFGVAVINTGGKGYVVAMPWFEWNKDI